jgi:glycosyltransferase involved in cell wall biosynthesis
LGYRGPIAIVPNGVDTDQFTPGDASVADALWPVLRDRPVVLFMSRLSREKGLDMLIPVWASLVKRPEYKDAVLVLAGPDRDGYGGAVRAMIERYDIASSVCVLGMLQNARKLAMLRRADVLVLPSYSENFGTVVAEALACGTPVITTTATPWEQLQGMDAGRWVAPSPGDLEQALREMLSMSPSQRGAMGQRGMALIRESYTWERVVGKLLVLYECILKGRPIPLNPEAGGEPLNGIQSGSREWPGAGTASGRDRP